ncbi:hypothetical protein V8C86DRAFT_2628277 [Haematococcus lacustris]
MHCSAWPFVSASYLAMFQSAVVSSSVHIRSVCRHCYARYFPTVCAVILCGMPWPDRFLSYLLAH